MVINVTGTQAATFDPPEPVFRSLLGRAPLIGGSQTPGADNRAVPRIERHLAREIDSYRDLLVAGAPRQASQALQKMLDDLPSEASPYIAFRIKANLGHCAHQLDDKDGALVWFDDAIATAPSEPRAVALKAHAMMVRDDAAGAYAFASAELAHDRDNEHLAAHLVEAAILLQDDSDPESWIPQGLLERERVLIARCVLHRFRGDQPKWRRLAKLGARRFPANDALELLAAEADVEEIAQACRADVYRTLSGDERRRVRTAAKRFEGFWDGMHKSEVPNRDDSLNALGAAMVARSLLGEHKIAMAHARDLITRVDDVPVLTMVAQMAQVASDDDVANAAFAKLPDQGPAAFLKGIAASCQCDWSAAAACFDKAEIPETERVFVDMIQRLRGIDAMDERDARAAVKDAVERYAGDPRVMIILSGIAEKRAFTDLVEAAYQGAVAHVGPTLHHAARVMIASRAYRIDDFEAVIRALDGHIETDAWSRELQWLADAHASEYPPRQRNLKFFRRLPKEVRGLTSIARGHATKLLEQGEAKDAEPLLRQITAEQPNDVFSQLKLGEALTALGRRESAKALVVAADEAAMTGPSGYRMRWAHALRQSGAPQRALRYAYDLLRSNPQDPQIALGYFGLIFADRSDRMIPAVGAVAQDCWVSIESTSGDRDAFIIDDGPAVIGIETVASSQGRAQRVLGLKVGDSFERASFGATVSWTVREVKSKYLAALHTVMETFETRFPEEKGLWRFSVSGTDVQPVLDVVREEAKTRRQAAERLYVESHLPLAFVARALGTDVVSLAHYLRAMGWEIVTAGGSRAEIQAGIDASRDYKGAGATLDTYTAITVAEIGCLDVLTAWFGVLAVPTTTIDAIDELIAKATEGLGTSPKHIGWKDNQFYRSEASDDDLQTQIAQLKEIKAKICACCVVAAATLPDDIPVDVSQFARTTGRQGIDAMYLAAERGDVLVSEDLFYRQVAAGLAKIDGTWLQVALLFAHVEGQLDRARYAKACAQLAYRRHGNLWMDDAALVIFSQECSADEFATICHYIGSRNADMWAHTALVDKFLRRIWGTSPGQPLKRETLTSRVLSALIRHRTDDWHWYIAFLWIGLKPGASLQHYLTQWINGHFLPVRPINHAIAGWQEFFSSRLQRVAGAASRHAMQAGTRPLGSVQLDLGAGATSAFKGSSDGKPSEAGGGWREHEGKRRRRRHRHRRIP